MTDYISREEAVALAMEYCTDDDGSCPKAGHDLRELLDDLENAPPADVRPVVQGRWKRVDPRSTVVTFRCSECNYYAHMRATNYCPNCGADMRKEAEA